MRKFISAILVSFLLGISGTSQAATDKILLQEIVAFVDLVKQDSSYWPGFDINSKPMVISACHELDPQQWPLQESCSLYAFNFMPNSNNWKKLSVDGHDIYYSPNDPYGITRKFNYDDEIFDLAVSAIKKPYTVIDGQLSYVYTIHFGRYGSKDEVFRNTVSMLGNRLSTYAFGCT